jgi:hypothetical protein
MIYYNEDNEMSNTEIIVNNTTNLINCIKSIKHIRKHFLIDVINDYFEITYDVFVYKYKECGWSNIIELYKEIYDNFELEKTENVMFDIDEKTEIKNIKKCIENCKNSDKKKLNWCGNGKLDNIGNINYEYIIQLLNDQNYKCYKCNDIVLTYSYIPFCSSKFSIDRLDNNKPHDVGNVKISCYFCNCKNHIAFNKQEKLKCEDNKCLCNIIC